MLHCIDCSVRLTAKTKSTQQPTFRCQKCWQKTAKHLGLMESDPKRPEYVLRLRPMADDSDPDGTRRIRALLKVALRRFRLRCMECKRISLD